MDIGLILITILLVIGIIRYFTVNIKRFNAQNVFPQSRLLMWTTFVIVVYGGIGKITDELMTLDGNFTTYIELLIYIYLAYTFIYEVMYKLDIRVENIYRPQLEELLEDVFQQKKLVLIQEEADEEVTTFSFLDENIKSRIIVKPSILSTKVHSLVIENKRDIPYLDEVLVDMNTIIPPSPKKNVLIKFSLKTLILAYVAWKIVGLFY